MPDRWDLVVVGGGVVGLLAALYAARKGLGVAVLEAEKPGHGASGRNAGVLHLIQPPPGKLRRRLAPRGARRYRELAETIGFRILETSLIIPALTRREELLLAPASLAIRLLAPGTRPRIAPRRELEELEPLISPGARKGLIVPGYGVVNPSRLVEALARAAAQEGATILEGRRVTSIHCREDTISINTAGEEHEAKLLVNAAGEGSHRLARQAGVESVRVELHAGAMELYNAPRPRCIIARLPTTSKTKGGAIIPWPTGETLVGPTFSPAPETQDQPGSVAPRYRPLIAEDFHELQAFIVGRRTVARPRDFHIIKPARCPRSVHLLGIESPGLTAAPILAEIALQTLEAR